MSTQTNSLTGQFVLQQDWGQGFWGDVLLNNSGTTALSNWTIKVTLPGTSTIQDIWGVRVIAQDGQTVTLAPADTWAMEIAPGGTLKVGMTLANATSAPRTLSFDAGTTPDTTGTVGGTVGGTDVIDVATPPVQTVDGAGMKYFGFNYASWWNGTFASDTSTTALKQLAATGANLTTIAPTQYQTDVKSGTITMTQSTESDANVVRAIRDAKAAGMEVMLKPHIDVSDGTFRGSIDATNPQEWFANYTKMLVNYAKIAQAEGVKVMSVGTELMTMTKEAYLPYWNNVIAEVRKVYGGELTYAANWGEEQHIKFWDKLDYIGVDLYAPLTETATPTHDQLVNAWMGTPQHNFTERLYGGKSIFDYHKDLAAQWGKPVFFTELGFKSIDGGNIQFSNPATTWTVDTAEQAEIFKAFVEAVNKTGAASWMKGLSLWNWEPIDLTKGAGGVDMYNFTPQAKPALDVISNWFHTLRTAGSEAPAPTPAPTPATPTTTDGGTSIVVNAHGTAAGGVNAHFKVLVDGTQIGQGTAEATAKNFAFTTKVTPDMAHKVQVQFDNDAYINGADRNLFVNGLTINGKAVAPTAPIVTYDKGALDGKDVVAGQSGMYWNGTLVVNADKSYYPASTGTVTPAPADGTSTITVNAWGVPVKGANAHFKLLVDGKPIGEGTAGTTAKDFTFTTSLTQDMAHKVQIQYDNDTKVGGQDRSLHVTKVTINGKDVAPTDPAVTYDKGALDGKDVVAGQSALWWNGTLVVNADKSFFPATPTAAAAPAPALTGEEAPAGTFELMYKHYIDTATVHTVAGQPLHVEQPVMETVQVVDPGYALDHPTDLGPIHSMA